MKKMNKMYEAPAAEMLEIETISVMMVSGDIQDPTTPVTPPFPGS
jgi:hypothetical protein